jgi:SnoaL-like domain
LLQNGSIGHAAGVPREPNRTIAQLAVQVREALESADLARFGDLLGPNVTWGAPDDTVPACRNKSQVLRWYERGRAGGRRAHVLDVEVHADKLLVHLGVVDPVATGEGSVAHDRWQVMTCARGRVVDIRGFETRDEAVARLAPTD